MKNSSINSNINLIRKKIHKLFRERKNAQKIWIFSNLFIFYTLILYKMLQIVGKLNVYSSNKRNIREILVTLSINN